jgi:hypothetical protein
LNGLHDDPVGWSEIEVGTNGSEKSISGHQGEGSN